MKSFRYFIGLLAVVAAPAVAQEFQSLQSIRDTVAEFAESSVDGATGETVVTVGKLDRRLRLAECELPLEAEYPNHGKALGSVTVKVRCDGAKPWSLMVQARIQQFIDVAVAARPLGRNLVLGSGDTKLARTDISRLRGGYFATTQETHGMVVKRSVQAGTVLTSVMLKPAILIKRGEKVIIRAESGSIQVKMMGQAMQAGSRGEVIQVKNLSSKRVIEAEVVSPGVVRVRM